MLLQHIIRTAVPANNVAATQAVLLCCARVWPNPTLMQDCACRMLCTGSTHVLTGGGLRNNPNPSILKFEPQPINFASPMTPIFNVVAGSALFPVWTPHR